MAKCITLFYYAKYYLFAQLVKTKNLTSLIYLVYFLYVPKFNLSDTSAASDIPWCEEKTFALCVPLLKVLQNVSIMEYVRSSSNEGEKDGIGCAKSDRIMLTTFFF